MSLVPTILLILAAVSVGAAVIAIVVALRSAREARSTLFPIVREEEATRARRARVALFVLSALTALFLGGWLATLRLANFSVPSLASDEAQARPLETPETELLLVDLPTDVPPIVVEKAPAEAAETITSAAVAPAQALPPAAPAGSDSSTQAPASEPPALPLDAPTFTPAAVVVVNPTPTASPTPAPPTAAPTFTPSPLPPTATPTYTPSPLPPTATPTSAALVARIPTSASRTPAPSGIKMGPIQFATGVTRDVQAINPGDRFPASVKSVYAVYPFTGMKDGLAFSVVWYQNGVELLREEADWQWGMKARSYTYLNPPGEGLYKVELYVNDSVLATGLFEIR